TDSAKRRSSQQEIPQTRPSDPSDFAAVKAELLVDPATPIVAAPNLTADQAAGDRAARHDNCPNVPDLGPCGSRIQIQQSVTTILERHKAARKEKREAGQMSFQNTARRWPRN